MAQAIAGQAQKHSTAYPPAPEGVVAAYVKAGFDVTAVEKLTESSDVDERLQYYTVPFSPGYDCWPLVLGFRTAKISEDANEARVKVLYENMGSVCSEGLVLKKKNEEEVIYHLKKEGAFWKIYFPYSPPHISVKTAIEVYERDMKVFPDRKKAIEKEITTLKKYLRN